MCDMKVIVVDDDRLVAISLKTIIEASGEAEVTAVGSSGEEAIGLYRTHKPDVLLMDIRMAGMTGLEAGGQILEEYKDAKILYLTTFNDDEYIIKALTIGAKGYIIKQDFEGIVPALTAVYEGQTVFGNAVADKMKGMLSEGGRRKEPAASDGSGKTKGFDYERFGLTVQENEVIECVAAGLSNKEIADRLFLSEGTVRNYLSTILHKLDIRDRTNLAIFYLKEQGR